MHILLSDTTQRGTSDPARPRRGADRGSGARAKPIEPKTGALLVAVADGPGPCGASESSRARAFGTRGFSLSPMRRASARGLLDAMQGLVRVPSRILALGPVCSPDSAENPSAELFYHIHGGQPYIFSIGNQQERVFTAACKVAHESFVKADPELVLRVLNWSSAQGWIEVYPQDGTPMAYDKNGEPVRHADLKDDVPRAGYNNPHLKTLLYPGDRRDVPDWLSPIEALQVINDVEIGTKEKPGRAIYLMNGIGPYLREDLDSVTGRGRVYQQLVDMRSRMTTVRTAKHILFNDGPGLMPTKAAELGSRFDMPFPTQRMLENTLFTAISNHLFTKVPAGNERADVDITDAEVPPWRRIVGPSVHEANIRQAISDGITLDAFEGFLPAEKSFQEIGRQLVGFTLPQAHDLLGETVSRASLSEEKRIDFGAITKARFTMLKQNFSIELVQVDPTLPMPVGLENVMKKLERIKVIFERGRTRKKPILPPKLMLLAGVPGMGKSLVAKKASDVLKKPLFKVDLSLLLNKFVGQSEENFKRMFDLLESLAPCVVWLDEIEKALGGTQEGSTSLDGGVSAHTHGLLLTWLEEHKDDVFLIGTSNEPQKLSAALLSRAAEKYFVPYQDEDGIKEMWRVNLDAQTDRHKVTGDDLRALAHLKPTITGREVAQRIAVARELNLVEGADETITSAHLRKAVAGWNTAYEQDPERHRAILGMSSAYQPAGDAIVLDPATGEPPERVAAALGGGSARDERGAGGAPPAATRRSRGAFDTV